MPNQTRLVELLIASPEVWRDNTRFCFARFLFVHFVPNKTGVLVVYHRIFCFLIGWGQLYFLKYRHFKFLKYYSCYCKSVPEFICLSTREECNNFKLSLAVFMLKRKKKKHAPLLPVPTKHYDYPVESEPLVFRDVSYIVIERLSMTFMTNGKTKFPSRQNTEKLI